MTVLTTAATVATLLVALLHAYILVLEMFCWNTPKGRKAFGPSGAKARCLDVVEWAAAQAIRILHNA